MKRRKLIISAFAAALAIPASLQAGEDIVIQYLKASPEERLCFSKDLFDFRNGPLGVLHLDDAIGFDARKALLHDKIMSVEPLEYNNHRVDLEGLLTIEPEDGKVIPVNLKIYAAEFDRRYELQNIVSLIQHFYLTNFNIQLNPQIIDSPFAAEDLGKDPESLRVVLCSVTEANNHV